MHCTLHWEVIRRYSPFMNIRTLLSIMHCLKPPRPSKLAQYFLIIVCQIIQLLFVGFLMTITSLFYTSLLLYFIYLTSSYTYFNEHRVFCVVNCSIMNALVRRWYHNKVMRSMTYLPRRARISRQTDRPIPCIPCTVPDLKTSPATPTPRFIHCVQK